MQTIRVRTTQNVFIDYPLASVGDRLLAFFIDRFILVVYCLAAVVFLISLKVTEVWPYVVFVALPYLLYSVLFEIFMDGQSPGKMVMKIKVVRLDGTPATVGGFVLRWLLGAADFVVFSGMVAIIAIAASDKGQRIGDMAAGTTVVKLREQEMVSAAQTFITPEDTYVPTFPAVIQLSAKDIELVQRALEANRDQGNIQPVMIVTEKIKTLLGIQTDMVPLKFLYTIVKDYNHMAGREL